MKFTLITLILLRTCLNVFGQLALIKDKDGYTNVRSEPNSKSEIVYQIKTDHVFWYGDDYYNPNSEWIKVYIPKNIFSLNCSYSNLLEGFVHKSRIMPFDKKDKYKGDELIFEYVTKPFSTKDKIIDYQDNKWIIAINGLKPWGTDGNIPKYEIEHIKVILNGQKIDIPSALTMDIYECDNTFDIYKIAETFFVQQWNSDGAGAYKLVWVINKNGIKQRLVGNIN